MDLTDRVRPLRVSCFFPLADIFFNGSAIQVDTAGNIFKGPVAFVEERTVAGNQVLGIQFTGFDSFYQPFSSELPALHIAPAL